MYPVPPSHESNLKARNWEVCKPVTHIRHLYALASNLCMQKHMNFSPIQTNHIHLGSSQTTHEDIFPRTIAPATVETSFSIMQNTEKSQIFNFLHQFDLFLLQIPKRFFIFSESLDPQDHCGINGSRIHPVSAELEISPRKWSYDLYFYCIVIYMIR